MSVVWTVSNMDCYVQQGEFQNCVYCVHWQCSGTQVENGETYNGYVYSTCGVTLDPDAPFTPYADLNQDQVLGWIWANGIDKAGTEAAVLAQIETSKNPPITKPPLPWSNA